MYKYIFMILGIVLIVAVASSPSVTFALPKMDVGDPGNCVGSGEFGGPNGLEVVDCCWFEKVDPGSGGYGPDKSQELYCMNCQDGGDRGYINCTDPELQYRDGGKPLPPLSGTINNGQISDDPANSNNNDSPNPGIGPKGGLAGGIDDIQSNDNIIQSPPDSDADESTTVTTNTQDRTSDVQTENTSESSLN